MSFKYNTIKKIEWEISTNCNARCPQCPRNDYGGKTIDSLPLIDVTLAQFQQSLTIEFIKQLEEIYFCGTYGDPCMNKDFIAICKWLKDINPSIVLSVHTNGGMRNKDFWKEAALYTDWIAFGIDGLEDTNHLYRKGTIWNRIINNVKAYIDAGGIAIWDYIVFRHNEHQVEEARAYSKELGFKEFRVKYTSRFFNKAHEFIIKWPVKNRQGEIERYLEIPKTKSYQNMIYSETANILKEHGSMKQFLSKTQVSCFAKKVNQIYISADGLVVPCGWLQDRLYGVEAEAHWDKDIMQTMWNEIGGRHLANVYNTKLQDIVEGPWFNTLDKSFNSSNRLERCGAICGELNFIGAQNKDVNQKNPTKEKQ
jgi:MoaA/NifB/PqqE/SkfB family radical SAM enzyme